MSCTWGPELGTPSVTPGGVCGADPQRTVEVSVFNSPEAVQSGLRETHAEACLCNGCSYASKSLSYAQKEALEAVAFGVTC